MRLATDAALREAVRRLSATSDTPRLDAELLMAHALGVSREALLLGDHAVPRGFAPLLDRRLAHEPVAHITGTRDFWTIELAVTPDVLIPRPDSETLIEAAVVHFDDRAPRHVLDLGTGSGALLLAALAQWPEATGVGIDASAPALAVALDNARQLGLADRSKFWLGNWTEGVHETFDLVLCNPPYIESSAWLPPDVALFEPRAALFAGADGLDAYRALAPIARLVSLQGMAALEIGSTQAAAVSKLFAPPLAVQVVRDLANRDRCLVLTHPA